MSTTATQTDALYILTLENDPDTPNPCDDEGAWNYVSFNNNHINSASIWDYFESLPDRPKELVGNDETQPKIDAGTAFIVSVYEHGNTAYSLYGEGMQDRWDTTPIGGLLFWTGDEADLPGDLETRRTYAKDFLEEYEAWANGACYYYNIETRDGADVDACGGYIGEDDVCTALAVVLKDHGIKRLYVKGAARWILEFQRHVKQLGEGVTVTVASEEHGDPEEEEDEE